MKHLTIKFTAHLLVMLLLMSMGSIINSAVEPGDFAELDGDNSKPTLITPSPWESIKPENSETADNYEENSFDFNYDLTTSTRWGMTWDQIQLADALSTARPWEPQVPTKIVILNSCYEIDDVDIQFDQEINIESISIPPVPEPEFIVAEQQLPNTGVGGVNLNKNSIGNNLSMLAIEKKINDYRSIDEYYPLSDYSLVKLERDELYGMVQYKYSLQLFPVRYNPKLGRAILYKSAKATIHFETEEGIPEGAPTAIGTSRATTTAAVTPAGTEPRDTDQEFQFIILTTGALEDELAPLAAWKTRRGLRTEIVDVNSIYSNETFNGYDEPDALRNFIRYAYKNHGTKYILLAGDYDTVPTRMCYDPDPYYGADDGEIPADSYYACISEGSTWDVDSDHIYGELGDLDDIYPDLAVGRIAINSELKMASWVNEIINYEQNPGIDGWTDKVILLGPNVHNEGDGAEQNEYYYNNYLKHIYKSFDKFYESSDAGNKQFSKTEIFNSINQGSTFINYLGHGGPTVWTYNYGYNVLMDKSDVNKFSNGARKPVVYAMSCLTEWFDDPSDSGYGNFGDCIGETYTEAVENGGIGYIGSARTSVGTIGSGYQPFATGLQEDFIRQLSQYNFVLGNAFTDGKKHYSESFGSLFPDTRMSGEVQACWLEVNLLGDPTLPLWTMRPQVFNITNLSEAETLLITVRNETNQPVKDATVCIQTFMPNTDQIVLYSKKTSSSGEALFDVYGLPVLVNLTITKNNFIPYLEWITLRDTIPPVTTIEISPNKPDGENGWYITIPQVNLSVDEEALTYYFWDDENNSAQAEIYDTSIQVPEGEHVLYYFSVDTSDNMEVMHTYQIKVDITSPTCALELTPAAPDGWHGWYIQQPVINLSTEPAATAFYAFDNDLNLTYPGKLLAPTGVHKLHFFAKDDAGNVGEQQTVVIKVDTTPPITNLTLDPKSPDGKNNWYLTSPKLSLESELNAEIHYYWDAIVDNFTYMYTEPITCPEGDHKLSYYSIDYAGCAEKIKTLNVKVDTVGPITSQELSPPEPNGENGYYISEVSITLTSEPNATIEYYWDDGTHQSYQKPIKAPAGDHILAYYAIDVAGNLGATNKLELKLDTSKPKTEIRITPDEPSGKDGWYKDIPIIEFVKEPGAVAYYHFDNSLDKMVPDDSTVSVPEGSYTIYYHSVDEAGNIGEENKQSFKVDITPPQAKLETDLLTYKIDDIITFESGESNDNFGIREYYIDFGDGIDSGWVRGSEIKHKYTKPGVYEVKLVVRDEAGIESENGETVTILIQKPDKESGGLFSSDLFFIIIIVIAIFIVLSVLFAVAHRGYYSSNTAASRAMIGDERSYVIGTGTNERVISRAEPEIPITTAPEPVDAIILDAETLRRIKNVKCVGCGTTFLADPTQDGLKCPGCGRMGIMKTGPAKDKVLRSESKFSKFKCPECDTIFKVNLGVNAHATIRCPKCGVTGEI